MPATTKPLYMEQGATFATGFYWCHESDPPTDPPTAGEPYDLLTDPASAHMQIRVKRGSAVLLDASTEGDDPMIVFGADGRVDIIIPGSATDSITVAEARYDLEITLGETLPHGEPDIHRLIEGPVYLSPNITQVTP